MNEYTVIFNKNTSLTETRKALNPENAVKNFFKTTTYGLRLQNSEIFGNKKYWTVLDSTGWEVCYLIENY